MKDLDFEPKKTTEQFRKNYEKHDAALVMVKRYLRQNHFTVLNYGPDRRGERIWGDDIPDLLAWQDGYWLVLIDCKGHADDTWILNKRAYEAYLEYSRRYKIPVVCIWVNLTTGCIYWAEIPFADLTHDVMPHDQNKVVKTKAAQPIDNLMERLRIASTYSVFDIPFDEQPVLRGR